MPPSDYPAAHSMDTTWFAIDRDGHVAVFESGEAGAVPSDALADEDEAFDAVEALMKVLPTTGAIYDLEAQRRVGGQPHVRAFAAMDKFPLIAFLDGEDAARTRDELLAMGGRAIATTPTSGVGVSFDKATREVIAKLHESGACLGCFYGSFGAGAGDIGDVAERGLYRYAHTTENWISGPYELEVRPLAPITVDQLPKDLHLRAVRFDGRFAETRRLQPAAIWPTESWQPAWLELDEKTVRSFEGREDEYEGFRESIADSEYAKDLVFEEP